ncbi:MAG: dockerin type I domain-containing protein [Clostridia bacterium]
MKKLSTTFAIFLAVIMFLSFAPFFTVHAVNPGDVEYNAHDVEIFRAFLEKTDDNGVKNGKKINALYNPDDPATWTIENYSEQYDFGVNWDEKGRSVAFYSASPIVLYGTLELSDCDALKAIIIEGSNIPSINIKGCVALETLYMIYPENTPLTAIDLSTNSALTDLRLDGNVITEIDLSANLHLKLLYIDNNKLTALDLSNNLELESLICEGNEISALDLSANNLITVLYCNKNKITKLNITGCSLLDSMRCSYNDIKHLDVTHNPQLAMLECIGNGMTELNVSGLPLLWSVECPDNALTSLDLRGTCIQTLYCNDNMLTEILVPDNSEVQTLYCQNNKLASLEFEKMKNLYYFNGDNNLLTELTLTANEDLSNYVTFSCVDNPMRHINIKNIGSGFELFSDGEGTIGAYFKCDDTTGQLYYTAVAKINEGASFLGWYDANGALVSSELERRIGLKESVVLYAKFTNGEEPAKIGDVNLDGEINSGDASLILKYLSELCELDNNQLILADYNNDKVVNSGDVSSILKFLVSN